MQNIQTELKNAVLPSNNKTKKFAMTFSEDLGEYIIETEPQSSLEDE